MFHTLPTASSGADLATARVAAACRKWTAVFREVSSTEDEWATLLDADPTRFASRISPSRDDRGIGQATLLLTLALGPTYTPARRRWIDDVFALIHHDDRRTGTNKYDILLIACCWRRVPFSYVPFAETRRTSRFELCTSAARLVRYYCSDGFEPDVLPSDLAVGAWARRLFAHMDAPRAHILEAMVPMLRALYIVPENAHAQEIFKFLVQAAVLGVSSTLGDTAEKSAALVR